MERQPVQERNKEEQGSLIDIQLDLPLRPQVEGPSQPRRKQVSWPDIPFHIVVPVLAVLVAVLAVVKLIDPFAREEAPPPDAGVAGLPEWIQVELLPVNPYSRPGDPLEQVNGVVIHYVGNPGTSAAANHSYFAGLAKTEETYASSHFLVGLEGEVLLNVPLDEIAYCSNWRNDDTISIECCHPDSTGEFTAATYQSLVELTRWLMETYGLDKSQVIRHYDVTGKECPRYFVQNPEAWENFLDGLAE